jgi:carbamoyl-phosphate synthase large subunit
MDALVTDVHNRAVVAGIRGLGRAGLRLLALADRRSAAGLWSRYCEAREIAPGAAGHADEFAETVAELARRHGPLVVYPGSEAAITSLLEAAPRLPANAVLPYPEPKAVWAVRDKRRLPALAQAAGLRAPETLAEIRTEELADIGVHPPFIIKSARAAGRIGGAYLIESEERRRRWAAERRVAADEPLLVQQWVRGPLVSVELVLGRDGHVLERFQQVTKRTWPRAAGSISFATSVSPDEELVELATRLLRGAGYWGLAQLDFVRSPDGPVLVDVNPRFYACLPLALACGVNLPAAWHAAALGQPAGSPASYPPDVSFRWLEGDLIAAARGSPRLLFERSPGPRAGAMWASDDPVPSALLGVGAVTLRVRRRLPRHRFAAAR